MCGSIPSTWSSVPRLESFFPVSDSLPPTPRHGIPYPTRQDLQSTTFFEEVEVLLFRQRTQNHFRPCAAPSGFLIHTTESYGCATRSRGCSKRFVRQGRRQREVRGVRVRYIEGFEQRERSWRTFSTTPPLKQRSPCFRIQLSFSATPKAEDTFGSL